MEKMKSYNKIYCRRADYAENILFVVVDLFIRQRMRRKIVGAHGADVSAIRSYTHLVYPIEADKTGKWMDTIRRRSSQESVK